MKLVYNRNMYYQFSDITVLLSNMQKYFYTFRMENLLHLKKVMRRRMERLDYTKELSG